MAKRLCGQFSIRRKTVAAILGAILNCIATVPYWKRTIDHYAGRPGPIPTVMPSGFYGAGKDNTGRCTVNLAGCHPIQTIGAPTSIISHFYAECPFCLNPPNLSWLGTGT